MEELKKILEEHYRLQILEISALEGYDSLNYKVRTTAATYVLKAHPYSEENVSLLAGEQQVLYKLQPLLQNAFPEPQKTNKGAFHVMLHNTMYRLLSYVEGEFLARVAHTPNLLYSFGQFLGRLDAQIHLMYVPAVASKISAWDIQHLPLSRPLLPYIADAKNRNLVDYFFVQFEAQVVPLQYQLRKGIIHGDANDWNVLTQKEAVSGIIDFGDMCYSWIINEVAIALTYAMMGKADPLESAVPLLQGFHAIFPLQEIELKVLYYLVAARLCISVCQSAYTKTLKPESDYITISESPAWELLHHWITINPLRAQHLFLKAVGYATAKKTTLNVQLSRRKTYLSEALSLSYNRPIAMERSAFQYMYDSDGNTFLDAYNNIMLAGHCHPKVIQSAQSTIAKLNTNTRYIYDELLAYSEKLVAKFPATLQKVFFVNSGSAASDLAIRMALTHTAKKKIMVVEHGYHGNTKTGIEISHYKYSTSNGVGKQDYIEETALPNLFNSGYKDQQSAATHFIDGAISKIEENRGQIAAFIAEPIVGCGGQVPLAEGYLQSVYKAIRAQGGVCISDEVQVGFGRLGAYFWGFEMHHVIPDMVILGKPMGNGHPIGAVVTTSEIAASFTNGVEFFSSFGGNPVSCAIGSAVLEVIEEEALQQHALAVGNYLITLLKNLQNEYSEIADIRGSGLFLGVELWDHQGKPNTNLAAHLKNGLREKHILIGTDGPFDHVLKIKPPLSFTKANADTLVGALRALLKKEGRTTHKIR
ncbi:aminotransferase class III-fold pyridoxal phosphate-dependent enzyme [Arenibacter sp. GZD96]|uniref:aminotransferase class III-fold pyridoxal phosphate-dependent enzyme n=1 Tax=Aurantibrevibacter litoralis TaxID=3106030 RepID=UPI002AFFB806|nr:aminotransferase class III-fold pyridoxal phosphate-dependent enzyme [Arenibacter sp. GZD-96]MEA1785273.1 aminotransferase class III-fold pyridoxal phosphate-dependent enzyme [Arenibacter sp. GZD-96]